MQAGMCRRGTCVGPNRCVCDHTYVFVFAPRVPVCLYLSAYRNVGGEYLYVGAICACMRMCVQARVCVCVLGICVDVLYCGCVCSCACACVFEACVPG